MASYKVALKIDRSATFIKKVTWKAGTPAIPVDLTGCTALAHIRTTAAAATILLVLSTANGKIALGGADGTVTLTVSAAETAAFTWLTGVYDLYITFPHGIVRRLMGGTVTVSPEVTRV